MTTTTFFLSPPCPTLSTYSLRFGIRANDGAGITPPPPMSRSKASAFPLRVKFSNRTSCPMKVRRGDLAAAAGLGSSNGGDDGSDGRLPLLALLKEAFEYAVMSTMLECVWTAFEELIVSYPAIGNLLAPTVYTVKCKVRAWLPELFVLVMAIAWTVEGIVSRERVKAFPQDEWLAVRRLLLPLNTFLVFVSRILPLLVPWGFWLIPAFVGGTIGAEVMKIAANYILDNDPSSWSMWILHLLGLGVKPQEKPIEDEIKEDSPDHHQSASIAAGPEDSGRDASTPTSG